MSNRERFYCERDRRTREYGLDGGCFEQPVAICVGPDAAESERGQLVVLALVNMLCRLHRRLCLSLPDAPLLAPAAVGEVKLRGHASLREAVDVLSRAIDPFIGLEWRIPSSVTAGIGLGRITGDGAPWYVGCQAGLVTIATQPLPVDGEAGFSLGACLAACVAASVVLKQVLGKMVKSLQLSAWNLEQGEHAELGPSTLAPVDVGRVLMVGAGGVGSCLAYWLHQSGVVGQWLVVDKDEVELHNTNRSLGLLPVDAGWPNGIARPKAEAAAELIGATACRKWFNELDQESLAIDLIMPLANEHGIRNSVCQRGEPLLLHATTSRGWEAQLHRHIAGRDDCIVCRMPPSSRAVQFACSTVPLGEGSHQSDAALPFLSATAGLLLVSGLYQLMFEQLGKREHNWWRVMYNSVHGMMMSGKCRCHADCPGIPSPAVRRVNKGRRWSHLDEVCAGLGETA